jgi:hypothetical protein
MQQGDDWLTAAVAGNRRSEIGESVHSLEITSLGDSQQASSGQLTRGTAVAEANLAPLHTRAKGPFRRVVGRLNAFFFQKYKEPLIVLEQGGGQIADLAVLAIQVPLSQLDNPLLNGERSLDESASIDLTTTELVPQSE